MHVVNRASLLAVLAAVLLATAVPRPAEAGTYTVTETCGNWDAVNHDHARFAVYAACPQLTARNVQGNLRTGPGINGGWVFSAPAGTGIEHIRLSGTMIGTGNWQTTIYLQGGSLNGALLEHCPGAACPGDTRWLDWQTYGGGGAQAVIARVRCGSTSGCSNAEIRSGIQLWTSYITIADGVPPTVAAGGALASGGWKSGVVPLTVSVADKVGVKQTRALIDGVPKAVQGRSCNYAQKVPCPNGADSLAIALGGLTDGAHSLAVQAVDAADNLGGSADQPLYIDNTPPVGPEAAALEGGAGWRPENRFAVRWKNPPQRFAPIAGARYELCPADADSKDPKVAAKAKKQCKAGERLKTGLEQISDLKVPEPGAWTFRLWLVDAAGNHNPDAAVKLEGLGFDPSPPTDMSFREQMPDEPARLRVAAADGTSGIASGSIEARRRGEDVWRPLDTRVGDAGLTASIDDEVLPSGPYDLRAVAVNGAGLQHATSLRSTGAPATIRLPVRRAARLVAGRPARRCGKRRCRVKLVRRLHARLDRGTRIRGRLTIGRKPVAHQELHVWSRLAMSGTRWEQVATPKTGTAGRFTFKAPRGPARLIRVRYPGTAQVRGANATVDLRVPARTSIKVSRRHVVNGEYATFRGRVAGRWIPPEGALVELQVFTRRRWRTFALPRAMPETRRWEFQYRFETIRGKVTFRFRARIRRQSTYPFRTGHSRSVRVTVRGQ